MTLREIAERIQREFGLGLTYNNLRKLKHRGRIKGEGEELYEQAVIYFYMRKSFTKREILEARKFFEGEKTDEHYEAIKAYIGIQVGATRRENAKLKKLGEAIVFYGLYLTAIKQKIDFVNNLITFRVSLVRKGEMEYTIKEIKPKEKKKFETILTV